MDTFISPFGFSSVIPRSGILKSLMGGWKVGICFKSLFGIANVYDLKFIKDFCGVEISSISTSPKREDTILLKNPFK